MSVDIWRRLLHMDKRIIYFTMLLAIVAPMFVPFGLPIRISQPMTDFYNTIQSMPEGSYVVIAAETSPSQMAEHRPAVMCLFRHLYERKARIIIQSVTSTQGPNLVLEWASPVINELGMEYGVDYAIPGYRTGGNATMDQARFNYIETFTDTDIYGGKLSALPIMQEFTKASDAYMVVNFHAGTTPYVNTWLATGDVSIILTAPNAVVITSDMVLYNAGLIKGLCGGMAGAAMYERLVEKPGSATKGMDSQGVGHLVIILLVIIGNIGYFIVTKADENRRENRPVASES